MRFLTDDEGNIDLAPDDEHDRYALSVSTWLARLDDCLGYEMIDDQRAEKQRLLDKACSMMTKHVSKTWQKEMRSKIRIIENYFPNPNEPSCPSIERLFFFKFATNGTTYIIAAEEGDLEELFDSVDASR